MSKVYYKQRAKTAEGYTSAYDALYAYSHGWKTLFNPGRRAIRRALIELTNKVDNNILISGVISRLPENVSPTGQLAGLFSVIKARSEILSPDAVRKLVTITELNEQQYERLILNRLRWYNAPFFVRIFTGGLSNLYFREVRTLLREYTHKRKSMDEVLKELERYAKTDVALHNILQECNQLAALKKGAETVESTDESSSDESADETNQSEESEKLEKSEESKKSGTYSELSGVMPPVYDITIEEFLNQTATNFFEFNPWLVDRLEKFSNDYLKLLHAKEGEEELAALQNFRLSYFYFMYELKQLLKDVDHNVKMTQSHDEEYVNSLNDYQLLELYMSNHVWVHKTDFERGLDPKLSYQERQVAYGTVVALINNLSDFCLAYKVENMSSSEDISVLDNEEDSSKSENELAM